MKPAQRAYAAVAEAISEFEPVTMFVSDLQYENCRTMLSDKITVLEISSDDAWIRDCGPTFLINDKGERRACDWKFNAWGGLYDGLYFPWDKDDRVAEKVCELTETDSYRTENFVLEGGSFHTDGQGTILTSEMCLLSKGRNPHLKKEKCIRWRKYPLYYTTITRKVRRRNQQRLIYKNASYHYAFNTRLQRPH